MTESLDQVSDVRALRLLRMLVITMTVVMIGGFLLLIFLLVTRFPLKPKAPPLPDEIVLPDGAAPVAFTQAADWYAVVTGDDRILVYDRETGVLRQTLQITWP